MLTNFKPKQNRPMAPKPPTDNLPTGETMSEGDTSGVQQESDPLMDYAMSLDDSEKQRLLGILQEQLGQQELEGEVDIEKMAKEMSPEDGDEIA